MADCIRLAARLAGDGWDSGWGAGTGGHKTVGAPVGVAGSTLGRPGSHSRDGVRSPRFKHRPVLSGSWDPAFYTRVTSSPRPSAAAPPPLPTRKRHAAAHPQKSGVLSTVNGRHSAKASRHQRRRAFAMPYHTINHIPQTIPHTQYRTPFTIPYHAIPYHAMPCHAMPCHAMSCYAMPCHALPCHTIL